MFLFLYKCVFTILISNVLDLRLYLIYNTSSINERGMNYEKCKRDNC